MTQVFLNHKTEEKTTALLVKNYLARCLISAWLDSDEIHGGSKPSSSITEGIATSRYFIALVSPRYIRSNWCMHELEEAQHHALNGSLTVIPVLLVPQDKLELDSLPHDRASILKSILSTYAYIQFDQYDSEYSAAKIATAIGNHNKILFNPIVQKTVQGVPLQFIEFRITASDGNLPTDILRGWNLNIERDFLAYHDNDSQGKPLRAGKPVALSGQGPNWLYAYLAIRFKNLCPVYLFNNRSKEYICIYDTGTPPRLQGNVLNGS